MSFDFTDFLMPAAILGSAFLSSNAASNASDAQAQAAQASGQQQLAMYNQNRADLLPYRETGNQALFALADMYGVPRPDGSGGFTAGRGFEGTPGYQFQMQEGLNAIDRSAAARGRLNSGATMRAAQRYGSGLANNEFNNYANRIATLANVGQTATSTGASLGANAASNAGNATISAGNARASGYTNQAGVVNNALGNALYWYGR